MAVGAEGADDRNEKIILNSSKFFILKLKAEYSRILCTDTLQPYSFFWAYLELNQTLSISQWLL